MQVITYYNCFGFLKCFPYICKQNNVNFMKLWTIIDLFIFFFFCFFVLKYKGLIHITYIGTLFCYEWCVFKKVKNHFICNFLMKLPSSFKKTYIQVILTLVPFWLLEVIFYSHIEHFYEGQYCLLNERFWSLWLSRRVTKKHYSSCFLKKK